MTGVQTCALPIPTGVMRHADAGYDDAREAAKRHGLNLPMLG